VPLVSSSAGSSSPGSGVSCANPDDSSDKNNKSIMTDAVSSRALRFVNATSSSEPCVSTSSVGSSMDPQQCARVRQSSVVAVARHACTELFSSLGLDHLAFAAHDKQSACTLVEQCSRLLQELSLSREAYVGELFSQCIAFT
jgi:hypothetical protein